MLWMILPLALALSPQQNPRVEYVISELVGSGFSQPEAEAFFADPRVKAYPPRTIQPRTIDWDAIIQGLVAPASVRRGKQFLAEHEATLRRAEEAYGVEKEVLTAILRVESNLGQNSGRYVVFNAYYTYLIQSEQERAMEMGRREPGGAGGLLPGAAGKRLLWGARLLRRGHGAGPVFAVVGHEVGQRRQRRHGRQPLRVRRRALQCSELPD